MAELVLPLAETIDRRGDSFNAGLGNANTSSLGSFLEGFTQSAADWTNIRTAQLRAQVEFDPEKIIADQVKRDLENERLDVLIRDAKIDIGLKQEFGRQKELANLRSSAASSTSTELANVKSGRQEAVDARQRDELAEIELRKKQFEIKKLEGLGMAREEAEIEALRTSGATATGAVAAHKEARIQFQERNKQLDLLRVPKTGKFISPKLQAYQDQIDAAEASNDPEAAQAAQDALDATMTKDFSVLPPVDLPAPVTKESVQQDARNTQLNTAKTNLDELKNIQLNTELRRTAEMITLERNNAETDYHVGTRSSTEVKKIRESVAGDSPLTGVPNLFRLTELKKQAIDPNQKLAVTAQLQQVLKETNNGQDFLDAIDTEITDPEVQRKTRKAFYKTLVEAGDPALLQPIQKNIMKVLSQNPAATQEQIAERVSDPDKVMEQTATLLTGNGADVNDDLLKGAIEFHPYTTRARMASKNGTVGFQIFGGADSPGGTAADTTGGEQQTQENIQFYNGVDKATQGAVPRMNSADQSVIDMLQIVGKNLQAQAGVNAAAQTQTGQIQQSNQAVAQGAQATAQNQAQAQTQAQREAQIGMNRAVAGVNPDPTQIISPFNSRRLATVVGFNSSNYKRMSDTTAEDINRVLKSVEDGALNVGTDIAGTHFRSTDEKRFVSLVENSAEDLWNTLSGTEQQYFIGQTRGAGVIGASPSQNASLYIKSAKEDFIEKITPGLRNDLLKELQRIANDAQIVTKEQEQEKTERALQRQAKDATAQSSVERELIKLGVR